MPCGASTAKMQRAGEKTSPQPCLSRSSPRWMWRWLLCGRPRRRSGGPQPDAPQLDASRLDAARMDVPAVCTERPLRCLPHGTSPRRRTLDDIQNAAAGAILQIRGLRLGRAWLHPFTTLHGCEGAELTDLLFFDAGQSIVERMTISGAGAIIATQTGNYIIRDNNFLCTMKRGASKQAHGTASSPTRSPRNPLQRSVQRYVSDRGHSGPRQCIRWCRSASGPRG